MSSNGQNNHNEIMSARASEVWLSLLEDLKQTPLAIPETWSKETKAHWDSEELSLVVTVPKDTNEVWLDRRFLPLAKIYFGEKHKEKHLVLQRKGRAGMDDLLVRIQRNVYEEIIEPQKIVPVQIYLFQHWLPVLSASPFWVTTAMRQVSFISKAEEDKVVKLISSRVLAKWTPLRYVQVSDWLNKGGYTCWFFKKVKESYEDVPPEYQVWSQIPVAPHHLAWIENYFKQHMNELSALEIVESLLDRTGEIRRVKPGEMLIPDSYINQRKTVLDIITELFPGGMGQGISDLVLQLEHQITRPNLAVTIPHYFYKFMDFLNPNEAALIWYLRSLYKEDEGNEVTFSGYRAIETALGCGNRTPQRLIDKCIQPEETVDGFRWEAVYDPDLFLHNWLSAEYLGDYKKGAAKEFTIRIRVTEPIHRDDERYYQRLIQRQMAEGTSISDPNKEGTHIRTGDTQNQTRGTQNNTGDDINQDAQFQTGGTHIQTGDTQIRPGEKQNQTGPPRISEHLNNSTTNNSLTDSFNDSLIPPLPGTNDPDLSTNLPVVGVREIYLEKLLGFGSYKHNEKKKLVRLIEKNQEQFLAWIIRNHITAAKFPVRLAVKNIQEGNVTEDQYLELARLGWGIAAEMARVREHDMDMWKLGIFDDIEGQEYLAEIFRGLSKPAIKAIKDLKDTDFIQLVENVLVDEKE